MELLSKALEDVNKSHNKAGDSLEGWFGIHECLVYLSLSSYSSILNNIVQSLT